MNFEDLIQEIWEWQDRTFKDQPKEAKLEHLKEEIKELKDSPYDPDEIADVFILMIGYCRKVNVDPIRAIARKFEELKTREWMEPDENGVIRHVKKV